MAHDLVIRGGLIATAPDTFVADLGIRHGRIASIGERLEPGTSEIHAHGLQVLPGGVDVHTHLDLDLGGTRTADDFESGTAAACGGIFPARRRRRPCRCAAGVARLGALEASQALGEDDASQSGACRASHDRAEPRSRRARIRAGYR